MLLLYVLNYMIFIKQYSPNYDFFVFYGNANATIVYYIFLLTFIIILCVQTSFLVLYCFIWSYHCSPVNVWICSNHIFVAIMLKGGGGPVRCLVFNVIWKRRIFCSSQKMKNFPSKKSESLCCRYLINQFFISDYFDSNMSKPKSNVFCSTKNRNGKLFVNHKHCKRFKNFLHGLN